MSRSPQSMLRILAVATAALTAMPAAAQTMSCGGILERYEEASVRSAMIEARRALRQELDGRSTPPEVILRLDNEIAALSAMEDGAALEDVAQRYRECRFDLFTVTSLPGRAPTVVASRCPPCVGRLWSLNDTLETLHGVAGQGQNAEVLQSILQNRDDLIEDLMICEQEICRDAGYKKMGRPIVAADYLSAFEAAADPAAWAREPVLVPALLDYVVPQTPIGIYPPS
jgi:hypothetical protein